MLFRCALFIVCFFPVAAFSQATNPSQIESEDSTISALLKDSASNPSVLINTQQSLITAHLWERLIEKAECSYDAAQKLTIYNLALEVASKLNDKKLIASTFYKLGRYHFSQGNIPLAVQSYLQSKQEFEAAGLERDAIYILADLGTLSIYSSNYKKAREYSEEAISLAIKLKESSAPAGAWPDDYGMGAALSNLGNVSKWEGESDKAIDYFQRSLSLYQRIDKGSNKYSTDILDNLADIGRVYRSIGDYVQALRYLDKAMDVAKALPFEERVERVAGIYNSLGILYTDQKDYSKAEEFFNQSLELAIAVNDRIKQARMLLNIGVTYQNQGNYKQALKSFRESLTIAEAIRAPETIILVGEGIGSVYKEQGKYTEALDWLNKSLLMAQELGDKTRTAELLWRKAEVHYAKGEYPESISMATSAKELAEQLRLQNVSYLSLMTLGKAYHAQRQDNLAMTTFAEAITRIEEMRNQVAGLEQAQELFFENKVASYYSMMELLLEQNKPADALLYAERAKGRVLLDAFSNGKVSVTKAMTSQEKKEEQELNQNILKLNIEIRYENVKKVSDDKLLKNLNAQLNSARLKYESFQNVIYASHPDLNIQRGQSPSLTPDGISNLVSDGKTAFLEYVVIKEKVFLFVLTKKSQTNTLDLRVYSINIKEEDLTKKINKFHKLMAERNPLFSEPSRELYDLLVKPAQHQLLDKTTLCIVPDGSLWDVPFQALQPTDNHFLIEDYELYYAPSLSVLKEMMKSKGVNPESVRQSLLAFGNPTAGRETVATLQAVNRGESFGSLPDAEIEVTKVQQIIGTSQSKVFIGTSADEKSFKTLAPTYNIIHLATHGVLDNLHPLYSYLLLSKAEGDSDNDGLLEAREIMNMNLHADLAVLSACETARGRVGAGEGVIGMSWAFFVAGVHTTVVSQWKVNTKSTSWLMASFYKHLKSENSKTGETKANALRLAVLELMKDERYRHPFYWAGFVMIGSNQ